MNVSEQVRSQVNEKKIGLVNFKEKVSKSFSTVENVVKFYLPSTEVHVKTPVEFGNYTHQRTPDISA